MSGACEVFVRLPLAQLQNHFEHAHPELFNKRVSLGALAPLAILAPPRHLRPPPQLPHKTLTSSFLAPVSMPPIHLGYSQSSASQGISRKWSRLNVQDEESEDDPIEFDDLSSVKPPLEDMLTPQVVDIEVGRKQPLARQSLLSRPQPAIYPPVRSDGPKHSILYPTFVHMVDDLVASGTLAGHKVGGM